MIKRLTNQNPAAVALGRLARGHKKTMTAAAMEQRQLAAKSPRPKKYKERQPKIVQV